jgi:hypothetical protein
MRPRRIFSCCCCCFRRRRTCLPIFQHMLPISFVTSRLFCCNRQHQRSAYRLNLGHLRKFIFWVFIYSHHNCIFVVFSTFLGLGVHYSDTCSNCFFCNNWHSIALHQLPNHCAASSSPNHGAASSSEEKPQRSALQETCKRYILNIPHSGSVSCCHVAAVRHDHRPVLQARSAAIQPLCCEKLTASVLRQVK